MKHLLVVSFALIALTSCMRALTKSRADVHIRYDAQSDVLELVELQYGIDIGDDAAQAAELLRRAFDGARVLPADGSLLMIDLDELVAGARAHPSEEHRATQSALLDVEGSIRVVSTAFFDDGAGRIGLLRRWELSRATQCVKAMDTFLRKFAEREFRLDEDAPSFPVYDRSTEELVRARLRDGGSFLALDDERLVLDLPMTPHGAGRTVAEAARRDELLAALFDAARELHVADGRMQLVFEEGDDGWFRGLGADDGRPECPKIRAFLAREGFELEPLTEGEAARQIGLERLPEPRKR